MVPGACDAVPAGEFWVPLTASWTMNTSWEEVPADYTPSAPTPLEDFLSKVRSTTFTVDPGTARERSYGFAAPDVLDVRTARDFLPMPVPDLPIALFLAKLPPLPPGDHRIAFSIEMRNRHCDGLGTASENCLNAARRIGGARAFDDLRGRELLPGPGVTAPGDIEAWIRSRAQTIYHPVGTWRMGNDALTVVNPRLRVLGIDGLRVADASIAPTLVRGDTAPVAMAIGERAADLIHDHSAAPPRVAAEV
jgi:hypothetical protein